MKAIKQYIEFAIENGYVFPDFVTMDNIEVYQDENIIMLCLIEEGEQLCDFNTIETITSKLFIEAIARGFHYLIKEEKVEDIKEWTSIKDWTIFYTLDKFELIKSKLSSLHNGLIREITTQQAIAIRDNKLPEYITNLLNI